MGEGLGGVSESGRRPVTSLEDVLQWAASGDGPQRAASAPSSLGAAADSREESREAAGLQPPAKRSRSSLTSSSFEELPGVPPGAAASGGLPGKLPATPAAALGLASRPRPSSFALRPEGLKDVGGFELQGLKVARVSKKLPKTQSWCFVPLIYSALGQVPARLWREGFSTAEQIEAGQASWEGLFSHWRQWLRELQRAIAGYGRQKFELDFLPRDVKGGTSWTTSMVYGEPRVYGRLPHPHGSRQDAVLALLPVDTQNQIFASVVAITSPG